MHSQPISSSFLWGLLCLEIHNLQPTNFLARNLEKKGEWLDWWSEFGSEEGLSHQTEEVRISCPAAWVFLGPIFAFCKCRVMQKYKGIYKITPSSSKRLIGGSGWDQEVLNNENPNCVFWPTVPMPSEKLPGAPATATQKNISLFGARVLQRVVSGPGNTSSQSTKAAEASPRQQDAFSRYIHTSVQEDRSTPWAVVLTKPPSFSRLFWASCYRRPNAKPIALCQHGF